jgi:hypothetical protein
MGWTGGDDPLAHIQLSFLTRAAAVAFAERERLNSRIEAHGEHMLARSG